MKYRDYLIVPALVMYLIYTSCAYIAGKNNADNVQLDQPVASICPENMSWGSNPGDSGDNWYADGARGADYFTISSDNGRESISFYNSRNVIQGTGCAYTVTSDNHLTCNNNGTKHDIIFLDELTAYDCSSGIYYQRGDYDTMLAAVTDGRFVNSSNSKDYYVFKDNGKSSEYFGEKIFKGKWSFDTTDILSVYDNDTHEYFRFVILYNNYGDITGIKLNDTVYEHAA